MNTKGIPKATIEATNVIIFAGVTELVKASIIGLKSRLAKP